MGVYPDVTYQEDRVLGSLTRRTQTPGLTVVETFMLHTRTEERDTCFCCSCDGGQEYGGYEGRADPYCRNHGFAGSRVCMVHRMNGNAYEPDADLSGDDETRPMLSVQAQRAFGSLDLAVTVIGRRVHDESTFRLYDRQMA